MPDTELDDIGQVHPQKQGGLIDALARLPERTILDETRLAGILSVTSRTIRRMVARDELPPSVSFGGRSVWFAGRILDHLEKTIDRATRRAEKSATRARLNVP